MPFPGIDRLTFRSVFFSYRLYQPGNPQNRVFLPNLWLKVVKPNFDCPLNMVLFETHPEMTSHDVREYLTKIYDLPVRDVKFRIRPEEKKETSAINSTTGKFGNTVEITPPKKMALVTMTRDFKFKYPEDAVKSGFDKVSEQEKKMRTMSKSLLKTKVDEEKGNWDRPGISSWFS